MKHQTIDNLFRSSNALKILAYLIDRPGQNKLPNEILKDTGLSRVGIYLALPKVIDIFPFKVPCVIIGWALLFPFDQLEFYFRVVVFAKIFNF